MNYWKRASALLFSVLFLIAVAPQAGAAEPLPEEENASISVAEAPGQAPLGSEDLAASAPEDDEFSHMVDVDELDAMVKGYIQEHNINPESFELAYC